MLPFAVEKYNLNCYMHQDNDSKHTSKKNSDLLKNLGISWVKINVKIFEINLKKNIFILRKNLHQNLQTLTQLKCFGTK